MAKDIEAVILNDIREMAQRIVLDEEQIKEEFLRHNAGLQIKQLSLRKRRYRQNKELSRLIQVAYEDRVKAIYPKISVSD